MDCSLCYLLPLSCSSSLEQREREAIVHVKESMDIVETALMEKDQAQIREQQLNHEIARLKRAMETIVCEAGERTSREVMAVREECNKSIDKMATEIHKLEEVRMIIVIIYIIPAFLYYFITERA